MDFGLIGYALVWRVGGYCAGECGLGNDGVVWRCVDVCARSVMNETKVSLSHSTLGTNFAFHYPPSWMTPVAVKAETLLVYIVDDDESVRKGLMRLMRSAGIESRAYESAECFLDEVHDTAHACILMDITMPHMNGLELAAQLKEKGITLPVIAISARDDDDARQTAHDMGVRFFLRKPVDDQALIDAISWVMQRGVAH